MCTENCRWWDCSDRKISEWTSEGELKSTSFDALRVGETCLHVTAESRYVHFIVYNLGGTVENIRPIYFYRVFFILNDIFDDLFRMYAPVYSNLLFKILLT